MSDVFDASRAALVLVDLQNDFLHPEGAYGRAGQASPQIAALPERLAPVAAAMRAAGGAVLSTHFTLVPGRSGEPMVSEHLLRLRPFLRKGDFLPGSFGHDLVDALKPSDFQIDKVAYSAFYMSRMEYVLRKAGIDTLVFAGIVTNGGVASTVRDAHVRDLHCIVLSDGCATFSQAVHDTTIASLAAVVPVETCADFLARLS